MPRAIVDKPVESLGVIEKASVAGFVTSTDRCKSDSLGIAISISYSVFQYNNTVDNTWTSC